MLKKLGKILFGLFLFLVIIVGAFYYVGRQHYNIPVLMYHYIGSEGDNTLYVPLETFKNQMAFIAGNDYRVLTLDEYIGYVRGGKKIDKKNLVLITFDDGHADNYQAYRVLNKLGMSAVFFIPSDKIGDQGRLSASEVVKMHNDGMDIGSHTKSEVYCPDLEGEDFKVELLDSKLVLEHLIGGKVKSIAYPMGGYNRATMQAVKEAGYKIAFTTNRGFDKHWRNDNPYQLRRIKVTFRDNDFKLWAKLTGFYNWLRSVKDPY